MGTCLEDRHSPFHRSPVVRPHLFGTSRVSTLYVVSVIDRHPFVPSCLGQHLRPIVGDSDVCYHARTCPWRPRSSFPLQGSDVIGVGANAVGGELLSSVGCAAPCVGLCPASWMECADVCAAWQRASYSAPYLAFVCSSPPLSDMGMAFPAMLSPNHRPALFANQAAKLSTMFVAHCLPATFHRVGALRGAKSWGLQL